MFYKITLFGKLGVYNENYKIAGDYEFWIRCFLDKSTTSKSFTIPIAVFQLNGISQEGGWGKEHEQIEQELLPHLMADFKHFEKLLTYENSRVLKAIIKIQTWFKK